MLLLVSEQAELPRKLWLWRQLAAVWMLMLAGDWTGALTGAADCLHSPPRPPRTSNTTNNNNNNNMHNNKNNYF